jgi:hypothetical protein
VEEGDNEEDKETADEERIADREIRRDLVQIFPLTVVVSTEGVAMQRSWATDGLANGPKTGQKRSGQVEGVGPY